MRKSKRNSAEVSKLCVDKDFFPFTILLFYRVFHVPVHPITCMATTRLPVESELMRRMITVSWWWKGGGGPFTIFPNFTYCQRFSVFYAECSRNKILKFLTALLRIRIRRIHLFLDHLDPNPDSFVRGTDPLLSWSKIVRNTLISSVWWLLYDFLSLKNDVNVR